MIPQGNYTQTVLEVYILGGQTWGYQFHKLNSLTNKGLKREKQSQIQLKQSAKFDNLNSLKDLSSLLKWPNKIYSNFLRTPLRRLILSHSVEISAGKFWAPQALFTALKQCHSVNPFQPSAYHPHSNLRAETAKKTVKRIINGNVASDGPLNIDFIAALL